MTDPNTLSLPRGKSYNCQEGRPWLKPGTVVWVQPGCLVDKPYLCIIQEDEMDWCNPKFDINNPRSWNSIRFTELCTYKPFQHGAVIWDYWVDRLSPAGVLPTVITKALYYLEMGINLFKRKVS